MFSGSLRISTASHFINGSHAINHVCHTIQTPTIAMVDKKAAEALSLPPSVMHSELQNFRQLFISLIGSRPTTCPIYPAFASIVYNTVVLTIL